MHADKVVGEVSALLNLVNTVWVLCFFRIAPTGQWFVSPGVAVRGAPQVTVDNANLAPQPGAIPVGAGMEPLRGSKHTGRRTLTRGAPQSRRKRRQRRWRW